MYKVDERYEGRLEDMYINGTYERCDFTGLSLLGVTLDGEFIDCDFTPAPGVIREDNVWSGTFQNCRGIGR